MGIDPVLLARIQFAATVGFHFIFPPISIGLAWLLFTLETASWRTHNPAYERAALLFARLFALTFAVGVATGITMEFQFGTNWAEYSKFVGDIFGAPLAAEAVIAFFLESTFIGLYMFGRGKISRGMQWFSIFMVAVGSTLSAFWILVANSWQQTPAGYVLKNGRAELTSFIDAVLNPSMIPRFLHTMDAAISTGAFFMAGVAAYLLLKNKENQAARVSLRLSIIVGLISSIVQIFPLGHMHAIQVSKNQPVKLATYEGLFEGQTQAPLLLFGIPSENGMTSKIQLPKLLSFLISGSTDTYIKGRNDFPAEERPPVVLPFLGFHLMVGLGILFILLMVYGAFQLYRGKVWDDWVYLLCLVFAIPLPVLACQLGWIATEVGRQPWIVYGVLKTKDAISYVVPSSHILFSLCMFGGLYLLLLVAYLWFMTRAVQKEAVASLNEKGV